MQQEQHSEVPPFCGAAREYLTSAAGEAALSRVRPVTPSLAVNTGSTLGGQTAFWLHSALRKGAWSSQWVSPGSAVQKNNKKNQNKPHISVRMKMRNRENCIWKNPPARDKQSSTAAGERREESREGGRERNGTGDISSCPAVDIKSEKCSH